MITALLILAWLAPGVVAHGLQFAWFQRKFLILAEKEYWSDMRFSAGQIILGPINLVSWFIFAGKDWRKYGFKLW